MRKLSKAQIKKRDDSAFRKARKKYGPTAIAVPAWAEVFVIWKNGNKIAMAFNWKDAFAAADRASFEDAKGEKR